MINLKAGDKAVLIQHNIHRTAYKIATIARETKTQLVLGSGQKFSKSDGVEVAAYSSWRIRDKIAELTPEMQTRVNEFEGGVHRQIIIRYIENARLDKLPTDVLEAIKQMVDSHAK